MSTTTMTPVHQSAPWEWALEPQAATRLPAAPAPRWLLVTAGRVWLTRSGAGLAGGDVWLQAGERHALPAGSDWVLEGWPTARVALLQAPQRPATQQRRARRAPWFAPVLHAA
jgi:hypothetical protein